MLLMLDTNTQGGLALGVRSGEPDITICSYLLLYDHVRQSSWFKKLGHLKLNYHTCIISSLELHNNNE